jgi:nucleoside phosphorylase
VHGKRPPAAIRGGARRCRGLYDRAMPVVLIVAATRAELCGHEGLECGVGPVEAAAVTARALAVSSGIGAVLHVGLAGAVGVPSGSLVIGSESRYDDLAAEWPVVERLEPDARLVEAARTAIPGAPLLPIHTSAAVGGARNTASRGQLVEAMEGFGVLRAAELARVPAVEVRAISNELGEEDRTRWQVAGALESLAAALPALIAAIESVAARTG